MHLGTWNSRCVRTSHRARLVLPALTGSRRWAHRLFTATPSVEPAPSSASTGSASQPPTEEPAEVASASHEGTPRSSPTPSVSEFSREPSPSPSPSPSPAVPRTASAVDGSPASHPVALDEQEEDYFASRELISELQTGVSQRGSAWSFALVAVLMLVVFCPFKLSGLIDMAGTLCLTAGIVFVVYAVISLGRNISPLPQPRKNHKLVTGGMYAYVRHPMYGGFLLGALGLACLSRSETRLFMTLLLWWILEQKAAIEERYLLELYPAQYPSYQASVGKYIPYVY